MPTVQLIAAASILAIVVAIVDEKGRFLGDSEADGHFAVRVPPGQHVFVSWSESTPAMRVSVVAGKTYFVEVDPNMGWGSARVQLLALTPRSANWSKLPEWLRGTRALEVNEAAGQARMQQRAGDLGERLLGRRRHGREPGSRAR